MVCMLSDALEGAKITCRLASAPWAGRFSAAPTESHDPHGYDLTDITESNGSTSFTFQSQQPNASAEDFRFVVAGTDGKETEAIVRGMSPQTPDGEPHTTWNCLVERPLAQIKSIQYQTRSFDRSAEFTNICTNPATPTTPTARMVEQSAK